MDSSSMTVVWERSNSSGKWFPYSGEVCQLLEKSCNENLNSVCLGDVDDGLKPYVVNLKDMVQVSEATGTKCQVRRLLFGADTGIAQQMAWQWKDGHDTWSYYSTEIMNFIENAYRNGQTKIDLSDNFHDYPYIVNFNSMSQKNKKTRRHRPIMRINVSAYPVLKVQPNVNDGKSHINMENGCEMDVDTGKPQPSDSPSKSKKVPLMKKMSNFWNHFKKSSDSDSENGADSACASVQKKQKPCDNSQDKAISARNAHTPESNHEPEYAIVNGKPWKHQAPPSTPASLLKPVPAILPLPEMKKGGRRGRKKASSDAVVAPSAPIDILDEFTEEYVLNPVDGNGEDQVCIICYEGLTKSSSYDEDSALIRLKLCSHVFHKSCIKAMYDSGPKDNHIQCPTCKTIHGVKHGIQPPGKMSYHVLPYSLPGHPDCETIRIIYDIPPGIQGPEHPNPGKHYSSRGFPRHCYLPDNEMGRKVLRLLIQAWERKLIFTIGSSSTTGEQNTVTWNEIHHKTEFGCNRRGHGYPDSNYFENVIAELAAQGVTESTYVWYPA